MTVLTTKFNNEVLTHLQCGLRPYCDNERNEEVVSDYLITHIHKKKLSHFLFDIYYP